MLIEMDISLERPIAYCALEWGGAAWPSIGHALFLGHALLLDDELGLSEDVRAARGLLDVTDGVQDKGGLRLEFLTAHGASMLAIIATY